MKHFIARSLLFLACTTTVTAFAEDQPEPRPIEDEPGFCETYEEDCERDNDEDGEPDNEEEGGNGL